MSPSLRMGPRQANNYGYSRYLAPPINMYDMKPNTYHSMHQLEQVSVSVSSTLAQINATKEFTRISATGQNLNLFIGWQQINRKCQSAVKTLW